MIKTFRTSGLLITTPDGVTQFTDNTDSHEVAPIYVNDWSFFWDILMGYDLGFAKSYLYKKWDHPNLTELFEHLARRTTGRQFNSLNRLAPVKLSSRIVQMIRSINTIAQSRKNISDHYDLGNEFFSKILDPTLTYSCGIFEKDSDSLEKGQQLKVNTLLEAASIEKGSKILDIGCGWGNLAVTAASHYETEVLAATISNNQWDYTRNMVNGLNLEHLVDVQLVDYRELEGSFSHIFSVEMLEAVGHRGISTFFKKCQTLLRPSGTIQIQVITIPDERYDSYKRNCDFIQKYIFPGGQLVSLEVLRRAAKDAGFQIYREVSIGFHYATTLKMWRDNLLSNWESIMRDGFKEPDLRRFLYYFHYCEGAFRSGHIDDYQVSLRKI